MTGRTEHEREPGDNFPCQNEEEKATETETETEIMGVTGREAVSMEVEETMESIETEILETVDVDRSLGSLGSIGSIGSLGSLGSTVNIGITAIIGEMSTLPLENMEEARTLSLESLEKVEEASIMTAMDPATNTETIPLAQPNPANTIPTPPNPSTPAN